MTCGCRAEPTIEDVSDGHPSINFKNMKIIHCPLHAAAGRMMDFVQKLADLIEDEDAGKEPIDDWIIEAGGIIGSIAKAEAEKEGGE